jgi:hypothetical protein
MTATTRPQVTQDVISSVNAYLLARTHAEVLTEKVTAIKRDILATANYYPDPEHVRRGLEPNEPVTDPEYDWLLRDDEFHDYLIELKARLIAAGYVINPIPGEPEYSYYCPALTAESLQRETEILLIESAAEMMGEEKPEEFNNRLLCHASGLETRQKFIDLVVKLVVNMPGYKAPRI